MSDGRARLLACLRAYQAETEEEERHRQFICEFLERHEQPFDRGIREGHVTGSALVVDATGTRVLLGFHRKLGRWLQFGGHGEPGDEDAEAVALREALEESGLTGLAPHPDAPAPLDVDVHQIPARDPDPAHLHLDIRYLLVAPAGAASPRPRAEEHVRLAWFSWDEALGLDDLDESLRRLLRKGIHAAQRKG
jgi:8-oxo-dGTP pyrophosphatase MutT (NUDIX family)